jgi:NADH:ubiquinone oxidoreductase subunit E
MSMASADGKSAVVSPPGDGPLSLEPLDHILEEFKGQKGAVIPILQRTQYAYGYLPREVLAAIARKTRIPITQLYGVATFYAQFHLTPRGRHLVRVCDGTACHVRGAPKVVDAVEKSVGVKAGETSADRKCTLEIVYCLGSCGLSPVAVVDDKVYGRLAPDTLVQRVKELK